MIPFGPYLLQRRIAVGGMAEVFLATHRDQRDQRLVVKRILPHLERKPDFVQMFEDEARVSSRLFHRNLVRIHDCGIEKAVHYIAMEYVDGLPLSKVLKVLPSRRMSAQLSCWIVAEACAGLSYAHTLTDLDGRHLGIVHRDISPDNILLSRAGEVKLADFGIAKASTRLTQTRPGQRKGKLTYMSPEQATGMPVDARSDIFSLGTVLYEMTTGERVFAGRNEAEVLKAVVNDPFVPPDRLVPDFPPALAEVIERALAKPPDLRFDSAATLRDTLVDLIPASFDAPGELSAMVRRLGGESLSVVDDSGPKTVQAAPETHPGKSGPQRAHFGLPQTAAPPVTPHTAPLVALRGAIESPTDPSDAQAAPDPIRGVHSDLESGPNVVVDSADGCFPATSPAPPAAAPVAPSPTDDDAIATKIADHGLTAPWRDLNSDPGPDPQSDPSQWFSAHEPTLDVEWDPADIKKLEGTPWGWVVLFSIAGILTALLLLLYYQD